MRDKVPSFNSNLLTFNYSKLYTLNFTLLLCSKAKRFRRR